MKLITGLSLRFCVEWPFYSVIAFEAACVCVHKKDWETLTYMILKINYAEHIVNHKHKCFQDKKCD